MVPNCKGKSTKEKMDHISELTKHEGERQGVNMEKGMKTFGNCSSFANLYRFFIEQGLF